MQPMTVLVDRSSGIVRLVVRSAARMLAALGTQLLDHPFTIDRLDASAETLWPSRPEELEPPRWRTDLSAPRQDRPSRSGSASERVGPLACAPMCRAETAR